VSFAAIRGIRLSKQMGCQAVKVNEIPAQQTVTECF
jgi:hypothetical protein